MIERIRDYFMPARAAPANIRTSPQPEWLLEQLCLPSDAQIEIIRQSCLKVTQEDKALKVKYGETPAEAYVLQREAEWLTRLSALNLTSSECIKFYRNGQQSYLLTNYLSGLSANQWLRERRKSIDEPSYIAQQGYNDQPSYAHQLSYYHQISKYLESVLDQLEAIHSNGFVHGDIKPSNIIFHPDNTANLIDFSNTRRIGEPWLERGFKQFSPSYFCNKHSSTATIKQDYYAYLISLMVLFEPETRVNESTMEGFDTLIEKYAEDRVISTRFKHRILALNRSL